MPSALNTLLTKSTTNHLCKAFGIRLTTNPQIVQLAKNSGFDALFIDLEHSTLSLDDASQLSCAGLLNQITPFVRVPYQCGNGFVQRVLDGGAMGVIFPHVSCVGDAKSAVSISKYPPQGTRSMTGQLPVFSLQATPVDHIINESNATASTVILMIETKEGIESVEEIAAVDGADVLLVGSNDLAIELGVPGGFGTEVFRDALVRISQACRKSGKVMGLAGIYDNWEVQHWAVNVLGVRFMLCGLDSGILASGGKRCVAGVPEVE
ncbi:HpcH/HpaI aldolase family protein [Aspergillus ibericus CBS 121593]|uniref:Phosphoenolpyruvate/pyruvate domain-containing protein n=1 Tax=Aspergillus ibericus CBS 121593 TaxID=1448316 RepID=A0A395GK12_9EURO|nr:Phosphoenolpyruvate/pyruvate domain-containing protein [Aspergillus ibericus CBS 121593]RAK95566.1 Phosphoenolpyruvate/pyruvate domain-containing protein [Aspergillus ibericus CBS 121593]